MSQRYRVFAFAAVVLFAAAAVVAARSGETGGAASARGMFDARKEAVFERGREANRRGPANPAAEQVENRAYPRSYVDDGRAAVSRKVFDAKLRKADRSAFGTDAAFTTAAAATPGAWAGLGPATGNVPGAASQFFDYDTMTGPTTQESGRVTALAIDPNCGKPTAP